MRHLRVGPTTLLCLLAIAALPLHACDGAKTPTAAAGIMVVPAGSVPQIEPAPVQETDIAFQRFVNTHVHAIKSDDVLREVLRQANVRQTMLVQSHTTAQDVDTNTVLRDLRRMLTVTTIPDTNLIEIRVSTKDRLDAPVIANAIADMYLTRARLLAQVHASILNELFTARRVALEKDIDEASKERDKVMHDLARQPEIEESYRFFTRKYLDQTDAVALLELSIGTGAQKKDAEQEKHEERRLALAKALLERRQEQLDESRQAWRELLAKQRQAEAHTRKLERLRAQQQRLTEALERMDMTMRRPDAMRVQLHSLARTPAQ